MTLPQQPFTGLALKGPIVQGFPDEIRAFLDREQWTYAKTMPTWPHEYLVKDRVDSQLFEAAVLYIRRFGYQGRFYQRPITYLDDRGKVYWTMGAEVSATIILNRCRKEDSYGDRERTGTLPERTGPQVGAG